MCWNTVKPGPTNEPQPIIYDPVLNVSFPLNLTSPDSIPVHDDDPVLFPVPAANLTASSSKSLVSAALDTVMGIIASSNSGLSSNCSKCVAALSVGQLVAKLAPTYLPDAMIALCQASKFASNASCISTYEAGSFGASWTQILAKAELAGLDGRYICSSLSTTFCPSPPVTPVKATFPKSRPTNLKQPSRSGKRVKVLHMSDLHLGEIPRTLDRNALRC